MAGELESLATDEGLDHRIKRHDYDRLIMLSDGVFAIAITLLAIELPLPEHWDGHWSTLIDGVGRPLIGYGFAFLMISAFWLANRRLMARIVRVDLPVTLLTLLTLGLVGLAPLVARLIAEQGPRHAMAVYVLMVGAILLSGSLTGLTASARHLLHAGVNTVEWRRSMLGSAAGGLLLAGLGGFTLSRGVPFDQSLFAVVMLGVAVVVRLSRARVG